MNLIKIFARMNDQNFAQNIKFQKLPQNKIGRL